ncbi:hypothetical protein Rs2_01921 [Raphanus sativus]|uniref:Uncharacterized protein LOC130496890 n=1 Tax=Raphanus sativus TaxID=3726 RepID=A0A9W3C1J3_RAPSA|nr:uncharacterized protein LOC130496890 [Raphanus sativus]KAJ4916371.1 hypothetical protein Rs2_01921 [Raphanus sativus]
MDERHERRPRLGLIPRQLVAAVLSVFTDYIERDLILDPPKTGRAFTCAWKFNKLADMCFMLVVIRIAITPTVMERLRRTREACDTHLVIGSISLSLSLAFSAYLRWFV